MKDSTFLFALGGVLILLGGIAMDARQLNTGGSLVTVGLLTVIGSLLKLTQDK